MKDELWHFHIDFNSSSYARDVLMDILSADKANYDKAISELNKEIELLDSAISLHIELLQAAYRQVDSWKNNPSLRSTIAMAESALNYIFLARHGVLLGYYSEVRNLLRSCYERISRCVVFFANEKEAKRFLSGEKIQQVEIDKKLSELATQGNNDELLKSLREYYGAISEDIYPNLHSFEARYGQRNLGERVGLQPIFGGIMSHSLGHLTITRILQVELITLKILGGIIRDTSGQWGEEYHRISTQHNSLVDELEEDIETTN